MWWRRRDTTVARTEDTEAPAYRTTEEGHTVVSRPDEHRTYPANRAVPGYEVRTSPAGVTLKVLLSLIGAAAVTLSALLVWFRPDGLRGTELAYRALWNTEGLVAVDAVFRSVAVVCFGLGALALIGMALRSGWPTRLAGALAVIAFVAYTITLYRGGEPNLIAVVGVGPLLLFVGGVVTLIGGFVRPDREVHVSDADDEPVFQDRRAA